MNIEGMSAEQLALELRRIARWMHDQVSTHDQHDEESSFGYCSEFDQLLDAEGGTISRIAARLSGMAADTWQPIETAPKDGFVTELQYKGGQVTRGHWVSQVRMWNCYGVFRDPAELTAWFRIPEPPHV